MAEKEISVSLTLAGESTGKEPALQEIFNAYGLGVVKEAKGIFFQNLPHGQRNQVKHLFI